MTRPFSRFQWSVIIMRMAITWADIQAISIPLCPQTVMNCELSAIATSWEPLRLCFSVERPEQINVQPSDSKVSSPVNHVSCSTAAKGRHRRSLWKNSSFFLWHFRPRTFHEMIIIMFIFQFFWFLAVFIVEAPSNVSGADRSILGAGSYPSMLGEDEISHDTCE